MKILNTFTLRNLIKNKKRTIVTIIGTILATCLLFVVGFLFSSIRTSEMNSVLKTFGDHHVLIIDEDASGEVDKVLKNNSDIEKIIKVSYIDINDDYELRSINDSDNFELFSGRFPTGEDEVIINRELNNYEVGDSINLNDKIYNIVGIYLSSKVDLYEYKNGYQSDIYNVLYTKNDNLYPSRNYIYYNDIKDAYDKTYLIGDQLGFNRQVSKYDSSFYEYENIYINANYLMLYGIGSDNFQKVMITWLVVILFALGSFSSVAIYNAFSISVAERKKLFGIFRSIGATKKNIFMSVLFEAFIIMIISVPLGLLLAFLLVGLGSLIIGERLSSLGLSFSLDILIYPEYLLFCLIFACLMILVSSLIPALKASLVSPIETIRNSTKIKMKKKNAGIWKLFKIEGILSSLNIKRNSKKYRSCQISLVISIILFMIIGNFINIYVSELDEEITYQYPIQITVDYSENQDKIIKEITSIREVKDYRVARFSYGLKTSYSDNLYTDEYLDKIHVDKTSLNKINHFNISSYGAKYEELKKKYNVSDDVVFLGNSYCDNRDDKYINCVSKFNDIDSINLYDFLPVGEGDSSYIPFNEEYIYNPNPWYVLDNLYFIDDPEYQYTAIVSDEEYNDIVKSLPTSNIDDKKYMLEAVIHINTDSYTEIDDKINALVSNHKEISSYMNDKMDSYEGDMMIKTLILACYLFIGFIVVIALTNVINTISTSIDLRKRDFAMLRSMGLSNKSFNKMIILESIILGVTSFIMGQVIANPFIFLVRSFDNTMPYPYMYLFTSFIGTILIILITMYIATRKIKNSNIIEGIREENV